MPCMQPEAHEIIVAAAVAYPAVPLLMDAKIKNRLCIDRRHAYKGNIGARNDRGCSSSVASDSSLMDAKIKNILCIDRRLAYRGGG